MRLYSKKKVGGIHYALEDPTAVKPQFLPYYLLFHFCIQGLPFIYIPEVLWGNSKQSKFVFPKTSTPLFLCLEHKIWRHPQIISSSNCICQQILLALLLQYFKNLPFLTIFTANHSSQLCCSLEYISSFYSCSPWPIPNATQLCFHFLKNTDTHTHTPHKSQE
jgi:hypothetical protein